MKRDKKLIRVSFLIAMIVMLIAARIQAQNTEKNNTVTAEKSGVMLPYQNPALSSVDRVKDLLSRLTLKEKATLMCDISEAIPRLGIKKFIWWSEALHGYANMDSVTVFPEPIGMAASFNEDLVQQVFNAVSDEARAKYNEDRRNGKENERFHGLSVWTPNVNIFRDPRWGRGQETYGEDPYLTSRMGIAVVNGLQGPKSERYRKLLACAKHYAVHSGPEWSRHELNLNNVSMRDLYETYLPAFKALVQEADVRQVMCAYQRLDDEPCCSNTRLMQRILREDWGFKHVVVSDCGAIADFWMNHKTSSDAVHSAAKGVIAGTDVECGFGYAYSQIPEAIERGLITEQDVDQSVLRLLTERFDLGEMDNDALVPWSKIPVSALNSKKNQEIALEMSRQTMTLLQNNNNILPLSKSEKKIAVIGPNADDKPLMWGSYNGTPIQTITILDGIKTKLPPANIIYDKGCDLFDNMITDNILPQCSIDGKKGIRATYWNNRNFEGNTVATDYYIDTIKLSTLEQHSFSPGVSVDSFSAKYETVYKADESGEIVIRAEALGHCTLLVNGETISQFGYTWRSSITRIPLQTEKGKEYHIELRYMDDPNASHAGLNLIIGKEHPKNYDELVKKLKDVDLVIFAGGISPQLENEEMPVLIPGFKGGDRTNIELPESQRKCLETLKAAGKKIILVNCSGSAIGLVPETKNCEAILQAWYAGEAGGQAIADVLFGDYNPSGKLPITFYRNIDQLPDFEDYAMKGRTYRYMTEKPLFPFGYGLSYTTFAIGKADMNKNTIQLGDSLTVTIPVSNTGKRDGTEIIQIYLRKLDDPDAPSKTLRAFQRIELKAGKMQNAIIHLSPSALETFDANGNQVRVCAGKYELLYGDSSDDNDLKTAAFQIQ